MEAVQDWVLSLCMACIAAGILQQFASDKARFSVIKLVLTLYILVTAFAPLRALQYAEIRLALPASAGAEQEVVDAAALARTQAEQTLAETIAQGCRAKGIAVQRAAVRFAGESEQAEIEQVTVVADSARRGEIQSVVREILGADVSVEVLSEDYADGTEKMGAGTAEKAV